MQNFYLLCVRFQFPRIVFVFSVVHRMTVIRAALRWLPLALLALLSHSARVDPQKVDLGDGMRAGRDEEYAELPDISDRAVNRRLKCGACRAAATEFRAALLALDRAKGKGVRAHDRVEALDGVCAVAVRAYGLQLRDNVPTERFSKDTAIARATGEWVTTKLIEVCGELLGDHDEEVQELYTAKEAVFSRVLCQGLYGACDRERGEL